MSLSFPRFDLQAHLTQQSAETESSSLTEDEREQFEERAAIREFEGEFPHNEAEQLARQEIHKRRTLCPKD